MTNRDGMKNKDAEKNNPCLKEMQITYKCFNDKNFNKEECQAEIANYKACKDFWVSILTTCKLNLRPFDLVDFKSHFNIIFY